MDVWLNTRVTHVDESGVQIGAERISASNVFWAAGVKASPLALSLGIELDRSGRVPVQPDLSVAGHSEVLVLGDLAKVIDPKSKQEVPGIAPAAMQMGRFAARVLDREARSGGFPDPARRPAFVYTDKGMLATIGRAKAVGLIGGVKVRGSLAWWAWLLIHILFLIGFRNRILVMIQWAWAYWTFDRGARLITRESAVTERTAATN